MGPWPKEEEENGRFIFQPLKRKWYSWNLSSAIINNSKINLHKRTKRYEGKKWCHLCMEINKQWFDTDSDRYFPRFGTLQLLIIESLLAFIDRFFLCVDHFCSHIDLVGSSAMLSYFVIKIWRENKREKARDMKRKIETKKW